MSTVRVDLGERGYDIRIDSGVQVQTDWPKAERVLIVSDSNVDPLHGDRVDAQYRAAGMQTSRAVIAAGEASKALSCVAPLYDQALAFNMDRNALVVALGGGVVGDLAGFFAATYLRGVRYVQVPTSLLAMVDSSVGGKTGVNLTQGKNLVGCFYQPIEVVVDLDTLATLPRREYLSGLAEIVKYGVIWDAELFATLDAHTDAVRDCDLDLMRDIIARCCEIKADVVARDEREGGLRAILNYGHTYAHALEKVCAYGTLLHGEAVSIGMVYAAELSKRHRDLTQVDADRLSDLLVRLGLPVALQNTDVDWASVLRAMAVDKKSENGIPRFVLADAIGRVHIGCEVAECELRDVHDTLV